MSKKISQKLVSKLAQSLYIYVHWEILTPIGFLKCYFFFENGWPHSEAELILGLWDITTTVRGGA